jgi:hypothetical protein
MPYKSGSWGEQAKERNSKRLDYFRHYTRTRYKRFWLTRKERSIGYLGEKEAMLILRGSQRLKKKEPDLLWGNKLIEVKTSSFHKWKGWSFFVKNQRRKCDFFLLICKDENQKTSMIFLVPDTEVIKDSICMSVSKINEFEKFKLKVR